jgi:23S rRNA (cytosine1962-C5)-methyltransferase
VYAQAIDRVESPAAAGDEVGVVDPRGNLLGRGFYSPGSAIPVRLVVRDSETRVDTAFFRSRVERALALRTALGIAHDPAAGFRLVHAEGDGLPGLIVDRYGDVLAVQFGTIGMKKRQAMVYDALRDVGSQHAGKGASRVSIVDRTSLQTAKAEGFEPSSGVVDGPPVSDLDFTERGIQFRIPLDVGQKTGFYFDQRPLRARVEELAHGKRVLDAYCFVGAFAIAAARGGASEVVAVDESARAVEVGADCAARNGVADRIRFVRADARRVLADARAEFDLVIADPPRLAPSRAAREPALVAYAKLAENGCRATRPGGIFVLCSCSAAIDLAALTRALATGAARAGVQALVLERWFQGPDHPVPAAFREGLYLKALVAIISG